MASEEKVRKLKNEHSAALLQTRGVCGVGVERDDQGDYVLTVHLSEDTPEVCETVRKRVGNAPLKLIKSGPFTKQ
jgi:hypothetical protein